MAKAEVRPYMLSAKQVETIVEALDDLRKKKSGVDAHYTNQVKKSMELQTRKLDAGVPHIGNKIAANTPQTTRVAASAE